MGERFDEAKNILNQILKEKGGVARPKELDGWKRWRNSGIKTHKESIMNLLPEDDYYPEMGTVVNALGRAGIHTVDQLPNVNEEFISKLRENGREILAAISALALARRWEEDDTRVAMEKYLEAVGQLGLTLDNKSRGKASENRQKKWQEYVQQDIVKHGDDALTATLPPVLDKGWKVLTKTVNSLHEVGITTRNQVLSLTNNDIEEISEKPQVGRETTKMISCIRDIFVWQDLSNDLAHNLTES
jgi:hypothetical protein